MLGETHPGGWLDLRKGYSLIERVLEADDRTRGRIKEKTVYTAAKAATAEAPFERYCWQIDEICGMWKMMPAESREREVMEALRDDQLLVGEIAARVNIALGWTKDVTAAARATGIRRSPLDGENLRSTLMQLITTGQLDRVQRAYNSRPAWRFFRRPGLDGPTGDLERAYREDRAA